MKAPSSLSTDHSKAVPLLQTVLFFFFVRQWFHIWRLFMYELEDLHADRKYIYIFTTMEAEGEGWNSVKLALAIH